MKKTGLVILALVSVLIVSGCVSEEEQPAFGPEVQPAQNFLYYSYSRFPALTENYAYLEGNTVTYFNRNVFNPDGAEKQDTAILVPEIPEVSIDVEKFISLSHSRHTDTEIREASYLNPKVTKVYFGQEVPSFITVMTDGETDYMDVYNFNTEDIITSDSAAHRSDVLCSIIAKFSALGTCSPEFNIAPAATYGLITNDEWAEAIEHMSGLKGTLLSWWDFTTFYSIFSGINVTPLSNQAERITETAEFLSAETGNWEDYSDWLSETGVDYILVDYTMPPKYAAISKIAGREVNIETFKYDRTAETEDWGMTMVFKTGKRTLQIPLDKSGNAARPALLSEGTKGIYFNELCNRYGVKTLGSETPEGDGCISMMGNYAYIIPDEAKETVFTSLIFMNGTGLPVEKAFGNPYVKLYRYTKTK